MSPALINKEPPEFSTGGTAGTQMVPLTTTPCGAAISGKKMGVMVPAQSSISSAWAAPPDAPVSITSPAMSRAGLPSDISPLVRKFSEKAVVQHPDNIPVQAVGAVVRRKLEDENVGQQRSLEWLRWLDFGESDSVDGIVHDLEVSSRKLINAWKQISGLGPSETLVGGIPTPRTLREAVLDAERKQDKRSLTWWGKAKARFLDFVGLMDDHKYLFDIIPQGDRYMSLFTGVVSSVVKASLEYKRICEGFSMAISSITSDLARIRRTAEISDTLQMKRHVVRLYVGIFEMFCAYLEWFQRSSLKRLAASFDRNFYPKSVEPRLNEVKESVQEIEKEANLVMQSRIKEVHQSLLKDAPQQRTAANESRQDNVSTSQAKLSRFGETLGYSSVQSLGAVEQQTVYEQNLRAVSRNSHLVSFAHVPAIAPATHISTSKGVSEAGRTSEGVVETVAMREDVDTDDYVPFMHRSDFERYINDIFSRYIEDGRRDVARNPQTSLSTLLPSEVVIGLQKWLSELRSTTIWVEGEVVERFGSGLSVAALRLCDASKEIGIPCISFICKQIYSFANNPVSLDKAGSKRPRLDRHEASLIALLYSVVAQLIYLLPDNPFTANPVLKKSNFERLDGTMASAPTALQIIRELAAHAPPSLIWILDNIQLVESKSTMPYLGEFVEFLRDQERKTNAAHEEKKKPYSKVCFTTDGNSWLLGRTIGVRERLDASRMAQRRPGRPFMGGADVGELGRRKC